MRILHVIASTSPEGGGPIEGVRQRGEVLREMGHSIEIACCDDPKSPWLRDFPFPVHALGPARGGYAYAPKLEEWLRGCAADYDGVVVNGIWQCHSRAAWRTMRALRRPYVVFTHGMLDPWFKRAYPLKHLKKIPYWLSVESHVLEDAAYVLFTSEEERVLARQSFRPYRVRERVVRYGVRGPQGDATVQREAFLDSHPELRGKRTLLFLSRIHPKKGCDLLIRAFAEAARADASLHLVLAGPDQLGWKKELEVLAVHLGIENRISWPGMLMGEAKWGAYHACDAFVLPSHQENFGIVVVEALACGKPVLISDKVNIWREVIAHRAGWVNGDTLEGTAHLISSWLASSPGDSELGANARRCYSSGFGVEGSAADLLEVMSEVLG